MTQIKRWFSAGDIDGFFGLMTDNLIQLLVMVALCTSLCGFSPEFMFKNVLPGVAISVLIGNLLYSWMAIKLMKKEGRADVTALPYGVNTVSLFAFIFFIILPVYKATGDFKKAWAAGVLATFVSGVIELLGSFVAEKIRKSTPRAALLSALAGIAITFISMDFLVRTYQNPFIAFVPFALILLQYFGKVQFPAKLPGGFVSVIAGTLLAWISWIWGKPFMNSVALTESVKNIGLYFPVISIGELLGELRWENIKLFASVTIPMGLFNVIGSLQNIESAEAAGDSYNTKNSLLINGAGTILGSFFGSPFPTTIYIGHPGWKGLGAREGYSILNGIFITLICLFGFMGFISALIPIEAGMAIVLWIGIVIGAQAFDSSPKAHAPAVIVGFLPVLAGWGVMLVQNAFNYASMKAQASIYLSEVPSGYPLLPYSLHGLLSLSQGFLLVSMVWASIVVFIIENDFRKAVYWSLAGSMMSFFGIIHAYSLEKNSILNTFQFPASVEFTVGYLSLAVVFATGLFLKKRSA